MYEKKETREKNYDLTDAENCIKKMVESPLSVGLSIKADNMNTTKEICFSLMHVADCLGIHNDYKNKNVDNDKEPTGVSFISRDEAIYTEQQELLEHALYVARKLIEFTAI
jgi:hypothetical protein